MKYLIPVAAGMFCLQLTFAQQYKKRSPEEKARFYTDEMVKELNLDSLTSGKVYLINLAVSKQFDSLYASKPEKDDARKGAIAIYKKRDAELRNILSTQQFLMFDDIQREKREKKKLEKEQKEKAERGE
jgi:hypothetical protein